MKELTREEIETLEKAYVDGRVPPIGFQLFRLLIEKGVQSGNRIAKLLQDRIIK